MSTERVRVGDVLSLQRREVVVEPNDEYAEIGVRSFGRGIFHKDPVPGVDLGNKRVFRIEGGDLVISNVFAWEGAIAVASDADAGRIGSHRFMTFVPTDDRIDTSWASWFFRSEPGLEGIRRASPGSAGRNRTLATSRFEALEIPLPPIDEQRRVAERVDRVEAAATELNHRYDRATTIRNALAVSATARPDLDDDAKSRAGWGRVQLDEVLTPSSDHVTVETANPYAIAGVYSFGKGLIDRGIITGADTSYKAFTRLGEDDVVVSKLNGWEGAVAVVTPRYDGFYVSSEYPTFKVDRTQLLPSYFSGVARSPWFWESLNANARGSMVRRRRINSQQFLRTEIWLPPMTTQQAFAEHLGAIERARSARATCRARAGALVPAALNQAFASLS